MPLLSLCSSAPRLSSGRYGRKVLSNVPSQKASDMMIAVLNNRWTLHIFFVAIIAILVPAAVYADCPSGQTCDVGIGSVEYTVLGPCDYSKFSTDPSACTIVTLSICVSACANPYNPPPPPPPPPLCVSGAVFCSTPDNILQDPDAQAAVRPLELEARQHIAALRGVPDDKLNVYWSRGEIRAYMYLRLLQMANSQSALSPDDQAAVDYYTNAIKQDRIKVANTALSLYATWLASPCTFQVPVGDPESYLQEPATAAACSIPPNSPVCLLGQCIPPPPSAEEFTQWAVGQELKKEIKTWGASLVAGPYIGLTQDQAEPAASLEYDSSIAGAAEGTAYLTAKHAQIANVPPAEESVVESDLQEQWLDALHDFAGDHLKEEVIEAVATVFKANLAGGGETTLAQQFGVETVFTESEAAIEESADGLFVETYDTFIGPAIAASAVIAFETWQQVEDAQVPVKLQAALDDANSGKSLNEYAQTSDGRNLIFERFVKSTMPDFMVARFGDVAYASSPNAGPLVATDPRFTQGLSATPSGSFIYSDWSGTASHASVVNGWFVSAPNSGVDALRYVPSVPYLAPSSSGNVEQWRAWLNKGAFISVRDSVQVGIGHVEEAFNTCPTVLVGTGTPVKLGLVCVAIQPAEGSSFSIKKDDEIMLNDQIRKAAGDEFVASDGTHYVQTAEPFGDPAPPDGTLAVLVHLNGDCLTSSGLGARVDGPDCVYSSSITTDQGLVRIAGRSTAGVSVTGGTFVYNGNPETATGFAYGSGLGDVLSPAVTLVYAGVSPTVYASTSTPPINAGSYEVTAYFAGNGSYAPATGTATLTISKAAAAISFNAGTLSQVYDGTVKTVATSTNPVGLNSVQLAFTGTPLNAGSYPVTATLNNPNYSGSISGTLVIGKAKPTVTFTGAPAAAAKGAKFAVSATTTSTAVPTFTATGACSITGNMVTMTSNSGTCQLTASWPADANYIAASASQQTATPGTQITSLITTINSFNLSPAGAALSFDSQLQQVSIDLQGTGTVQACNDLSLFISHVQSQNLKQLTAAQSAQMLAGAARIGGTIGCP